MENYKYGENTLLHSIGFDPFKLESILTHGILSKNMAEQKGVSFAKNYFGYNFDDHISMTRYLYVNYNDSNSSFMKYVPKGISFLVENQPFVYDTEEMYFNHPDEVFVKDKIDKSKITGILLPDKYLDYNIKDLPMIPLKSTSYVNIKHNCDNIIKYLQKYNYEIDKEEYNELLTFAYKTLKALEKEPEDKDLIKDFNESKYELDEFISCEVANCFSRILKKDEVTLFDMVNFINSKTLNKPIYSFYERKNIRG